MTDDIDNDGTTLHESGGLGLQGLPEPVGFRTRYRSEAGMVGHYPWTYADPERRRRNFDRPECEYEDLHTATQLRAYGQQCALAALAASPLSDGWVSVKERFPTRWTEVLIWPRPSDYCHVGQLVMNEAWECHEYETGFGDVARRVNVTHWQALPAAPAAEDRSQS